MLTRSRLLTLEQSLRSTRVLSVYLTGWTDDPAKRGAWRIALQNAVALQREHLERASRTSRDNFNASVRHLWAHLDAVSGVLGDPGWVAFVTPDGVIYADTAPVALPLRVVWAEGLQVAPYVRALKQCRPAAIAVVDSREARLYRYGSQRLSAAGSIQADKQVPEPQHMGAPPRRGFHTGTRGSTGADVADRAHRAGRDRMLRELAARLAADAGPDGWMLIGGIAEVVDAAVRALPETDRPRARRIASLDVHATEPQIAAAAELAVTDASRERDGQWVDEIVGLTAANGKGIIGKAGTLEALRQRAVDRLLFTDHFLRECPLDVELAVTLALDQQAEVEHVSGAGAERLDAEGRGIGARLRFLPTREQAPVTA